MKKVLAIPGSIRASSSNYLLLRAIADMMAAEIEVTIFDGLAGLPAFDPGAVLVPGAVTAFRDLLRRADGVIICTPEYAHGVPGSLKNAIDWTVASCEFSGKPTVLITASTDGRFGHAALLETLRVIEARDVERLSLLIPFVRSKIDQLSGAVEASTLAEMRRVMEEFVRTLTGEAPSIPE
ncbi:MAG TPA: NAD(P)H-dependent oxidoreductase [Verrucomicrobiae bacterium]|nr:NAD(P)H-dependent oxidoreductase [Verrucomicrobiae bacterium]